MSCRRVLSSTPLLSKGFGNRVRQRGKETYKLELTNKKYKYYKLLESGKQVGGPLPTQALVGWHPNIYIFIFYFFFFRFPDLFAICRDTFSKWCFGNLFRALAVTYGFQGYYIDMQLFW
jgi:hypothetical protein